MPDKFLFKCLALTERFPNFYIEASTYGKAQDLALKLIQPAMVFDLAEELVPVRWIWKSHRKGPLHYSALVIYRNDGTRSDLATLYRVSDVHR